MNFSARTFVYICAVLSTYKLTDFIQYVSSVFFPVDSLLLCLLLTAVSRSVLSQLSTRFVCPICARNDFTTFKQWRNMLLPVLHIYILLLLLLLLLLGPRHIQPSTYTNVATYPLGKYKQCHRKHSEQCACTCGNDTYAYVHRQGSLTGIRKPQY